MNLNDVIYYFCSKFPDHYDIGRERIHLSLYLVGWKLSNLKEKNVADLNWIYSPDGPISEEIDNAIAVDDRFIVHAVKENQTLKNRITLSTRIDITLEKTYQSVIESIYELTGTQPYSELTNLVFSTYPMLSSNIGDRIDMRALSKRYLGLKSSHSQREHD